MLIIDQSPRTPLLSAAAIDSPIKTPKGRTFQNVISTDLIIVHVLSQF